MHIIEDNDTPGAVRVLDIPLFDKDIPSAVDLIVCHLERREWQSHCVSATGAHGLVYSKKHPLFRDILTSFFINLPDGTPAVWIGRLKGAKKMRRCYGPDFFKTLLQRTAPLGINHFFCGGNPGVAEELKDKVSARFQNDHVTGTLCPEYLDVDQYDYASIAKEIQQAKADIVWIGLSTPKQEQFANRLAKFARVKFIITVGAAFDFHTDRVAQAPRWIQRAGLEWLFRTLKEPKRLYRRYLEVVPLFLFYNFAELLIFAAKKMKQK
jgi:N-acetylglucosaminyldiphosphoundecaprenol N-acetyl-beta-D-mannosaminyltransferase